MQFLRLRRRVRGEALRRVFQASRNGVARGVPREYPNRHRGGAVQEHALIKLSAFHTYNSLLRISFSVDIQ